MYTIYEELIHAMNTQQVSILETVLNPVNQSFSKQVLNIEDVPKEVLDKGYPIILETQEEVKVIEPFYNKERLIILGGGHIAKPLSDFAVQVGFEVVVIDDRISFANHVRFPNVHQVICCAFEEIAKHIDITPHDFVVVITRGHRHDKVCLEQIFEGVEPFYTGMIGSKRRVRALKELLVEEGLDQSRLDRIHTPIGLSIGAVTPAEISIAIMAEMIQCKRQKQHKHMVSSNHSDVDYFVLEHLAKDSTPKAIVTIIEAKGSVPRRQGAKMLVYPDGRIVGSIGGGCSEAGIVTVARGCIGTGKFCIEHIDMTGELAEEEGMVCGGTLTVLIEDDWRER